MTHERDPGENLSFLCARNRLILLCISHHAALWPSLSLFFFFFIALSSSSSSEKCSFLQRADVRSRRSSSRFLARRLFVPSSSSSPFFDPFALFHLRPPLPPPPPPPRLSINLFFSLRSSGPRNEQRKSIGWHCGFVSSTVVLDPRVGRSRARLR